MDLINGLSISNLFNASVIVACLSKKHHYALCVATNKKTSAKTTADIFIRYVFRYHKLPKSIILDQDPQLISSTWKAL